MSKADVDDPSLGAGGCASFAVDEYHVDHLEEPGERAMKELLGTIYEDGAGVGLNALHRRVEVVAYRRVARPQDADPEEWCYEIRYRDMGSLQ